MKDEIPRFIYGTAWKEESTQRCVLDALTAGFRAIDTANQRKHYYEAGVGAAILEAYEKGVVTREDLFLQTKFTHLGGQDNRLPYDPKAALQVQVLQSFNSSLEHLHTQYLDSYILHGPSTRPGIAPQDWEVWRAMEAILGEGKVKSLGVSNVILSQLEELCERCSIKPAFVQNRCFARTRWDRDVRAFCRKNGILYQGFSLLTANGQIFPHPAFQKILSRYGCTAEQLVFSFAMHVGMLPLTGTTNLQHMNEDLAAAEFKLATEDINAIEAISDF